MPEEFDFEIDRVAATIRERLCRKVLLQFPEGLKRQAPAVATALASKTKSMIIVSGEPCFGACDLPDTDADLTVHYGHLPIPCLGTPNAVLFIQARSSADPAPALERALPELSGRVGLITTAQHIHLLEVMADFLRSRGVDIIIGKGDQRVYSQGQVLGCNASCAKAVADNVDMFLFVGTGNFHPLAVALSASKPVLAVDPVSLEVADMADTRDRLLRQRHAAIERAREARDIGILVSSKRGQRREAVAQYIFDLLVASDLNPVLVEMGLVTPAKLDGIGLGAWVSTACPRLAIDDYAAFSSPVLTPPEAEIMAGKRTWSQYIFDEIL